MEVSLEAVVVTDAGDPRIAAYGSLRERDLVGRQGCFVAEGEVVLRVLLQAVRRGTHRIDSLFLSRKQAERLAPMLAALPAGVPIYTADVAVLEAVVGFNLHRGILALGRLCAPVDLGALLRAPSTRTLVGLFGITNHDNVGGIFRNLAAFGVDAAVLDQPSCDPHYRKAIRVSVGGVFRVPFFRGGDDLTAVSAMAEAGYELVALSPSGEERIEDLAPAPRRALLLGAEGPGLSDAVMARCRRVRFDMAAGFDSLNVATTSGIALYTLSQLGRATR